MKTPKLTKPQRLLLLSLAREASHWKYPSRKNRLPVKALAALGYVATQRRNGSYIVGLTEAGHEKASLLQARKVAEFERWNQRSIAVGCGPWPEVLRPLPLAPWKGWQAP